MADATDIRQWAKDKGLDIGERGRPPKEIVDQYNAELAAANGEISVSLPDDMDTGESRPFIAAPTHAPAADAPPAGAGETKPAAKQARWPWKSKEPKAKEPKPAKQFKRVPLETWAARGWKLAGKVLGDGRTPSSRCLYMQAPVAGVIIDGAIKDTWIDKMAQPIARAGEKGKEVGALVGLPLFVALTERQPQLYEYTRPAMVSLLEEWVLLAGPAMRKAKARAKEIEKELGEFEFNEEDAELFASPPENPAIARMLDAIFAPMMATPATAEKEPAAA